MSSQIVDLALVKPLTFASSSNSTRLQYNDIKFFVGKFHRQRDSRRAGTDDAYVTFLSAVVGDVISFY